MDKRSAWSRLQQHQQRIARRADRSEAVDFFNLLTSRELLDITEVHLPEHRERLYPPTVTLSMFIKQVLDADGSCQRVVRIVISRGTRIKKAD